MSHYSNPTATAAIGAVDRKIRMMCKRVDQIKHRRQQGLLTPKSWPRPARSSSASMHASSGKLWKTEFFQYNKRTGAVVITLLPRSLTFFQHACK